MRDARLMALDLGFPRLPARPVETAPTLSRESRLDSGTSSIEDKKTSLDQASGPRDSQ